MNSILHGLTPADIDPYPFPHVTIDGALPAALYAELAASMPTDAELVRGGPQMNNITYRTSADRILPDERIAARWRELVRRHTSSEFFAEVVALFGATLRRLHPDIDRRIGKRLEEVRTSVRNHEPFADAALDCQIMYGSPLAQPARLHPVHVDREVALYAGLLYFRRPDDDSAGGDLELYRFTGDRRAYNESRFADESLVERVKTIPYAANRLVFFPHSPDALHAVSVRAATPHPRLHVNFLAEFREKVWTLSASVGAAALGSAARPGAGAPIPEARA